MVVGREPRTFAGDNAPRNYVAGLGRGATGFTTRSDIGPAQTPRRPEVPAVTVGVPRHLLEAQSGSFGDAPEGYIAGVGRGSGGFGEKKPTEDSLNRDAADYSETNYDTFTGFAGSLVANINYEKDDDEADKIWDSIDKKMEEKRKRNLDKSSRHREQLGEAKQRKIGKISEQFADLKSELKHVTAAEWDSIPEASTGIRHRKKVEKFTPISDSIISQKRDQLLAESYSSSALAGKSRGRTEVIPGEMSTLANASLSGGASSLAGISSSQSMTMSQAKNKLLQMQMDKFSDSVTGQTVIDPRGYLTTMNSLKVSSSAEIGDIKKARSLYKSLLKTNPKHAPGWIAAARLEEYAGKQTEARKLIMKGCENCALKEEVWLEAARLLPADEAKSVLAHAVKHLPKSVNLWLAAAELETANGSRKKRVLQRALEFIPNSVKLWQQLIELEADEDEAKILLNRATECVPHSVEMWLALARLETYQNAQKVLNKARAVLPAEPKIWIAACRLEENVRKATSQSAAGVSEEKLAEIEGTLVKLMQRAVKTLNKKNVVISRDAWLKHAKAAEDADAYLTAKAIIWTRIDYLVEEIDQKRTFVDDAVGCEASQHFFCAKCIFDFTLERFQTEEWIWLKFLDVLRRREVALNRIQREHLEMAPDSNAKLAEDTIPVHHLIIKYLKQSVECCPESELLWLMAAKEIWLSGDLKTAREVIQTAFKAGHTSERVWLAAAKLESESNEYTRAQFLLKKAREGNPTPRIYMKSALLERDNGNVEEEKELLAQGLLRFKFDKLYMMAGQAYERDGNFDEARKKYSEGVKQCLTSAVLHILLARLEERVGNTNKTRSVLEIARLRFKDMIAEEEKAKDESEKSKSALVEGYRKLWVEAVQFELRLGKKDKKSKENAQLLLNQALKEKCCADCGELWALHISVGNKPEQKARSVVALDHCGDNAFVMSTVAVLFWNNRKKKRARKWFQKAVHVRNDIGDIWATYYAFEKSQHGKVEEVAAACEQVNPTYGEVWCSIRKDPANKGKSIREILELTSAALDLEI